METLQTAEQRSLSGRASTRLAVAVFALTAWLATSAVAQQACDSVSDCQVFPQWEADCVSNQCEYTCGVEEGDGCGPEWVEFATSFQRNVIGLDEPVNWVTRIGAHNASASEAYGSLADPNQILDITAQIEAGARILAIDLHVLDEDLYLCHNDLCFENRELFSDIMDEIGLWLDANPQEFLWISIEYRPYQSCEFLPDSECQDGSLTFEEIQEKLEDGVRNGLGAERIYRPTDAILAPDDGIGRDRYVHPLDPADGAYYCSVTGNACAGDDRFCADGESCELAWPTHSGQEQVRRWPTLKELRRERKQVLLTMNGTNGCCFLEGEDGDTDCGVYSTESGMCSLHSTTDTAGQACSGNSDCTGLERTLSWLWDDGATDAVKEVSKDFDYLSCTTEDSDWIWDPEGRPASFSSVGEARTFLDTQADTSGIIKEEDVGDLMACNPSQISLDYIDRAERTPSSTCAVYIACTEQLLALNYVLPGGFGCLEASCPVDDTRVLWSTWSWQWGVRPSDEAPRDTRVYMNGIDSRWNPTSLENQRFFRCACGNRRTGEPTDWIDPRGDVWEVTSRGAGFNPTPERDDRDTGQLCQLACRAEHGLDFALPVNDYQNQRLYRELYRESAVEGTELSQENAWLRLSRDTTTGPWTSNVDPWISSVTATNSATAGGFSDIEVIVDNPEGFKTQVSFFGDDGVSSELLDPVAESDFQQTFTWSKPFAIAGAVDVEVSLFGIPDPTDPVLRLFDSETITIDFNQAPAIEAFDYIDRSMLTPLCNDVCIGHLLQRIGRFTDPDVNDPFQVRILYGDADDSSCQRPPDVDFGVCTGLSNGRRVCVDHGDCGFVIPFTQEAPGVYSFDINKLYAKPGIYEGMIEVDDGSNEARHTFTVSNLDAEIAPEIGGGCAEPQDPLAVGDRFTCSPVFTDSNSEDTHVAQVEYGDGAVDNLEVIEINSTSWFVILDHEFEEAGTYDVVFTVTDSSGRSDTKTYVVEVGDKGAITPPTIQMLSTGGTVINGPLFPALVGTQGEPVTRRFRIVDDTPSHDRWQLAIAWGDLESEGSVVVNEIYRGLTRNADGNIEVDTSHVYPCEFGCEPRSTGTFGVHVLARAELGDTNFGPYSAPATFSVNIDSNNTTPRLDGLSTADGEVDEGGLFTRPGQSFSDPDEGDAVMVYVDWGDGILEQVSVSGRFFDLAHTYRDSGVYTVQVIVSDGTDNDSRFFDVVVNNVRPSPSAGGDLSVELGAKVDLTGGWTDPAGTLDAPYTWNWSVDGLSRASGNAGFGELIPYRASFDSPGDHVLSFEVSDKDGDVGLASILVSVSTPPPIAYAGLDQALECSAPGSAPATLDGSGSVDPAGGALRYLWTSEVFAAAETLTVTALFPLGATTASLVVTNDAGLSDEDSVLVTVRDTRKPALTAPDDVLAECSGRSADAVDLGEPLVSDACDEAVRVSNDGPARFPLGTSVVRWTATDASGNVSMDDQRISVVDTTGPEMTAVASPANLWPPNHKMVPVTIDVAAKDVCDAEPACRIVSVSSNEEGNGKGDGNTEADWVIDGDLSLRLRAERSGRGSGRSYAVGIVCEDASGNIAHASATIRVEQNR